MTSKSDRRRAKRRKKGKKKMNNNNVPIIGKRKISLGAPGREAEIQLPSEIHVSQLIAEAQEASRRSLVAQGQHKLAATINAFQLEPAAFAVFVGAADAIAALRKEIDDLREEIKQLQTPDDVSVA